MDLFSGNIKVGIYISRDHLWFKTYKADSLPFGLKAVVSELDSSKYSISICDKDSAHNFDFVFYSVNSFVDYLVLIRDFRSKVKRRYKLVVGGASLINLHLLRDVVDIAVVGRAEGQINDILEGRQFDNVWTREDIDLKRTYKVRQPQYLLKVGNKSETNVGCKMSCKFCQYGNKFGQFVITSGYTSGVDGLEMMFKDIDWELARSRVVSSIDGSSELTRKRVGKPLSNQQIQDKLEEINSVNYNKALLLKLYNIVGFPWEDETIADMAEFKSILCRADSVIKKNILWINMQVNHFVPMLLTPFESEPVNLIDYRKLMIEKPIYEGKHIRALFWRGFSSRVNALDETYVFRSMNIDEHITEMSVPKYFKIEADQRVNWYISKSTLHGKVTNLPSKIYG